MSLVRRRVPDGGLASRRNLGGVARHDHGPYRSTSINSYLVETRILGVVALLVLVAGVVLDVVTRNFWARNALLAGLLSSLIVVMLSAAVLNEAVERRKRRRWSVLAQYVMLELVRQARLVWTGVMELTGLMPADAGDAASIDAAAQAVHDTPRLKDAVHAAARRRRQAPAAARVGSARSSSTATRCSGGGPG